MADGKVSRARANGAARRSADDWNIRRRSAHSRVGRCDRMLALILAANAHNDTQNHLDTRPTIFDGLCIRMVECLRCLRHEQLRRRWMRVLSWQVDAALESDRTRNTPPQLDRRGKSRLSVGQYWLSAAELDARYEENLKKSGRKPGKNRWTRETLAYEVGLSVRQLSNWEKAHGIRAENERLTSPNYFRK